MSRLGWYWHRLRAMDRAEVAGRLHKKCLQFVDARRRRDWTALPLKPGETYPCLPGSKTFPEAFRKELRHDVENILAGKWRAFGHLPLRVSDPPEWHKDYFVGVDLFTKESAFSLDHRALPSGADIKLIWELSRWHEITRLALGAHALGEERAAWKCVHWLEHWVQHNPAYCGWNWTSALESGLRLIQFTWIEALLRGFETDCGAELEQLRYEILPPHAWFTWRHRSFGSSANNHLVGELAGLITATVRWPRLSEWGAPLDDLQRLWEREVLAQFSEDGGNKEQALHYHLFSFELCWHTRNALRAAGRIVTPAVEERLAWAARFFSEVQARGDHWDFGDSDDAFVLPLAAKVGQTAREWVEWAEGRPTSLGHFIGEVTKATPRDEHLQGWQLFRASGIAVRRVGRWFLRWDVSPLGYLSTAAHGHLDALHLSIWVDGVAMIVDPGTGAYYADGQLRKWLASRHAHNGPCPAVEWPERLGPFLWAEDHGRPTLTVAKTAVVGELAMPAEVLRRSIALSEQGEIVVEDSVRSRNENQSFTVLWQFAPESECTLIESRKLRVTRRTASMEMRLSDDWLSVDLADRPSSADPGNLEGTVSAHFRTTAWAPYLKLTAKAGHKPCVFRTAFLISSAS